MDLTNETKESLFEHIEILEDERETLIELLSELAHNNCEYKCFKCQYKHYCSYAYK